MKKSAYSVRMGNPDEIDQVRDIAGKIGISEISSPRGGQFMVLTEKNDDSKVIGFALFTDFGPTIKCNEMMVDPDHHNEDAFSKLREELVLYAEQKSVESLEVRTFGPQQALRRHFTEEGGFGPGLYETDITKGDGAGPISAYTLKKDLKPPSL